MILSKTETTVRFAATTLALAFLAGCGGGPDDGTTSEVAVQSTQEQSDAWAKAKAEGTDKTPLSDGKSKSGAKASKNYSGSPIH